MIDRVITFSIRHRWLVVLAAFLLAVWGIRAAFRTPVDAIPDLSENQVIVFTEWPGHGPREIEDQVSYPLTLELKGLRGVRVVRSSSEVGFSMISVIFEDGVGWETARREVGEVLARSGDRWPAGATPRLAPDAAATGQIFWYTVEGGSLDPGRLRAVQDWYVRPQLAGVQGVAEVASVGGLPLEYQVELDPLRYRAFTASLRFKSQMPCVAPIAPPVEMSFTKETPNSSFAPRAGSVRGRDNRCCPRPAESDRRFGERRNYDRDRCFGSSRRRRSSLACAAVRAAAYWKKTARKRPAA